MQFIQTIYFDSFKHAIEYIITCIYLPQAYLHEFIANVANLWLIQTIYLAGADEDITPMDTNNTPQVDIQGPITRARAR
jgi:hypothetical protein